MRKIKAVVFDLDNTLVDFMRMKRSAVRAAAEAMVGSGLKMTPEEVYNEIFKIYEKEGIEDQFVFNKLLEKVLGRVDWHIRGGKPNTLSFCKTDTRGAP
jgi:beta-phosphoglucomutase-like phosphatase (HAD superfamily)